MHYPLSPRFGLRPTPLAALGLALMICAPDLALAQASPFMTGASSLQTNILAWLTPVAIILVMVLGGMAMANRMSWGWCIGAILGIAIGFGAPQIVAQVSSTYGHGDAHTIVENCGNTLILRCSASEGGGTARFASQLIGEREVLRTTVSKSRRVTEVLGSITHNQHLSVESAVLPSQVEQLADLTGYLKYASNPAWQRVRLDAISAWQRRRAANSEVECAHGGRRMQKLWDRDHD
jgi:type IV secretory pathway VirB2 component (pilin)